MTDKLRLHIPIQTSEQIVIRDEVAKMLSKESNAVVLTFEELVKVVDGTHKLFPVSIVEVYRDKITDDVLNYFKELAVVIASKIGDSVVIEVMRESIYLGTAEPKED